MEPCAFGRYYLDIGKSYDPTISGSHWWIFPVPLNFLAFFFGDHFFWQRIRKSADRENSAIL
jgi:hypothetical protein